MDIAFVAGRTLNGVLQLLRNIDTEAFETLSEQFRLYAACVGLLDTGYFRKRTSQLHIRSPAPRRRTYEKRGSIGAPRYLESRSLRALIAMSQPIRVRRGDNPRLQDIVETYIEL